MSQASLLHADGSRRLSVLMGVLFVAAGLLVARHVFFPPGGPAPLPLPAEGVTVDPLSAPRESAPRAFTRLSPEQTGVNLTIPIDERHSMRFLYFSGTTGGGVGIGDLDQDGKPDLFLVNGPGRNRLYRQIGDLVFEDVTDQAGVGEIDAWGTGCTLVDVNNDGRLDIYVCNYDAPNELYINQGGMRFRERAAAYALNLHDASMLGAFADYDRDGDLDMYLLTYRYERPQGRPRENPVIERDGKRTIKPLYEKYYTTTDDDWQYAPVARADGLLRNNGDGMFSDVSEQSGVRGLGHGLSVTWWDYNDDNWPDIYVANDFMDADQLLRNNGDGTFTDVIAETVPNTAWYSMGSDVGDLNQDGRLDLLVADMSATTHYRQKVSMGNMGQNRWFLENAIPRQFMRNTLLLSTGTDRMQEAAYLAGLSKTDWTWTVKLQDLDNDGRTDAYFTNGSPRDFTNSDIPFHGDLLIGKTNWDLYQDTPERREKNLAFQNLGELEFRNVSAQWGLDHEGISLAAAHGDLDGDGDLDLVVANLNEPVSIYRNDLATGHAVEVELVGRHSNRFGVGAHLRLETDAGVLTRQVQPSTGFLASNEPIVHFGLGEATGAERLEILWPSGLHQELHQLEAGRRYRVVEPADAPPATKPAREVEPARHTLFVNQAGFPDTRHSERPFDDYQLQALLPNKLSQFGPGLAWGDADQDGNPDLFLGGAAGQAGSLLLQHSPGRFRRVELDVLQADADCEDMGALWVDVDGDGDDDLYVVSGSVEYPADDLRMRDRLYWNEGKLRFVKATAEQFSAPAQAGSIVAAGDVDRDGDLDLFVGGRVLRGQYPLSPASTLLRNDQGRLEDATSELLAADPALGMVTSALWTDVDDDGWLDLLVTTEWGPIRTLHNEEGRLVDRTAESGLAELTGWWNGIAPLDADQDGDLDYVVTNFGLNTKYHASAERPALLYYGDFDNTGEMNLVEAEFENETLFPVRGKSCSTSAMPFLADRFESFHSFALASLQDIYTPERLDKSYRFAATELRSGVIVRESAGKFRFAPLPRTAQLAPAFGCVTLDYDLDRRPDLFLAQNFFEPQPETGRMNGGLGQLLENRGGGSWECIEPSVSGLVVAGDARSATAADLNRDGRLDLVVGLNDDAPSVWLRRDEPTAVGRSRQVRCSDRSAKNRAGWGARLVAHYADNLQVAHQLSAGSGYLSQESPELTLADPPDTPLEYIEVVWPDGERTRHEPPSGSEVWVIERP